MSFKKNVKEDAQEQQGKQAVAATERLPARGLGFFPYGAPAAPPKVETLSAPCQTQAAAGATHVTPTAPAGRRRYTGDICAGQQLPENPDIDCLEDSSSSSRGGGSSGDTRDKATPRFVPEVVETPHLQGTTPHAICGFNFDQSQGFGYGYPDLGAGVISSPWSSNLQPAAVGTPAAASKAERLTPAATPAHVKAATPQAGHVHDDVSPSSDQPQQKVKGSTGAAVPKPRCLTGTPPPPAAAAAAGGGACLDSTAQRQCSSQTVARAPFGDYCNCGTALVGGLLRSKQGLQKLKKLGNECQAGYQEMAADGRLQLSDYDECTDRQNQSVSTYRITMLGQINYSGKHMAKKDWDQQAQGCPELCRSSEIDTDDKRAAFEESYEVPALHFECRFKKVGQQCFVRGSGLSARYKSTSKKELVAAEMEVFRKAVFQVTVVLLLLWHGQGRQQHHSLQQLAEQHGLGPVRQQQGPAQQQTSTAVGRAGLEQRVREFTTTEQPANVATTEVSDELA